MPTFNDSYLHSMNWWSPALARSHTPTCPVAEDVEPRNRTLLNCILNDPFRSRRVPVTVEDAKVRVRSRTDPSFVAAVVVMRVPDVASCRVVPRQPVPIRVAPFGFSPDSV
jgi:hypothetical protein